MIIKLLLVEKSFRHINDTISEFHACIAWSKGDELIIVLGPSIPLYPAAMSHWALFFTTPRSIGYKIFGCNKSISSSKFEINNVTLHSHLFNEELRPLFYFFFILDTFVSLAIPSLQLRLTTSLFSNLDSKLKTNSQYLSIDQCRVLVLICSHILLRSCLVQIPLALCSAFSFRVIKLRLVIGTETSYVVE
jgi:hypothetical protein